MLIASIVAGCVVLLLVIAAIVQYKRKRWKRQTFCKTCGKVLDTKDWMAGLESHYCSIDCSTEWARHIRSE